jgi:hypothetical protein
MLAAMRRVVVKIAERRQGRFARDAAYLIVRCDE